MLKILMEACIFSALAREREAKADLKQKRKWGGDSSLLCMVANNEDSQCGALRLLMENGCDVNATWSAHSMLFSTALKASLCLRVEPFARWRAWVARCCRTARCRSYPSCKARHHCSWAESVSKKGPQ